MSVMIDEELELVGSEDSKQRMNEKLQDKIQWGSDAQMSGLMKSFINLIAYVRGS